MRSFLFPELSFLFFGAAIPALFPEDFTGDPSADRAFELPGMDTIVADVTEPTAVFEQDV